MSKPFQRFFRVPHQAADDNLPASCLLVLGYLCAWWSTTGEAYPSIALIAKETKKDERTVRRAISRLRPKYVLVVYLTNQTSQYLPGKVFTQPEHAPFFDKNHADRFHGKQRPPDEIHPN